MKNEKSKIAIREKMDTYMRRAEEIKEAIDKRNQNPKKKVVKVRREEAEQQHYAHNRVICDEMRLDHVMSCGMRHATWLGLFMLYIFISY